MSTEMNRLPQPSPENHNPFIDLQREAMRLFPGAKPTDRQFSLTRQGSNGELEAVDVVIMGSDRPRVAMPERMIVTKGSSEQAELLLKGTFGEGIVPKRVKLEDHEEVDVYSIPLGSRMLSRTIRRSPYVPQYTSKLYDKLNAALLGVKSIDAGMLGLGVDSVATIHNGHDEDDDAAVIFVPPFKAPGTVTEASASYELAKLQSLNPMRDNK